MRIPRIVPFGVLLLVTSFTPIFGQRREIWLHDKYLFGWSLQTGARLITIDTTVETTGWVGLGFNDRFNQDMRGADIVMGGMSAGGQDYFGDFHGVGPTVPVLDDIPSYELIEAWENGTHTYMQFRRYWDTEDSQDMPISTSPLHLLWSIGGNDNLQEMHVTRGSQLVTLIP